MTVRLTSQMLVAALVRRAHAQGGHAAVLRHGDDSAGAVVLVCMERGRFVALMERTLDLGGHYRWARCGPDTDDQAVRDGYLERRWQRDPDLWLVELDIAHSERFAAETTGST